MYWSFNLCPKISKLIHKTLINSFLPLQMTNTCFSFSYTTVHSSTYILCANVKLPEWKLWQTMRAFAKPNEPFGLTARELFDSFRCLSAYVVVSYLIGSVLLYRSVICYSTTALKVLQDISSLYSSFATASKSFNSCHGLCYHSIIFECSSNHGCRVQELVCIYWNRCQIYFQVTFIAVLQRFNRSALGPSLMLGVRLKQNNGFHNLHRA